ncbi:unnamed protein product [Hydatigera taeniaeformis]|uniref:Citrate transport protein n=1 Tax=Hydatigena taeniaeformis TaxID=6205 RepID=A0A0R3WTS9_HYDTA|nr:unnamed protein product [Hydatigera taeniaeformis]
MPFSVYAPGLSGLYNGLTPTIFKQGTNQAIRFFVMESLKEKYRALRGDSIPNQPVPKVVTGLFGIIAGAASVYGNTPLDVVKTRMQVHVFQATIYCPLVPHDHLADSPPTNPAFHSAPFSPIFGYLLSSVYPPLLRKLFVHLEQYCWRMILQYLLISSKE